jgi:hypothetical protein
MAIGNVGSGTPRTEMPQGGEQVERTSRREGAPGTGQVTYQKGDGQGGVTGSGDGRPVLPPPKVDYSNSAILLMEMYHALSEQQGRTSKETILANRDHAKTLQQEVLKKLEEVSREMEKAAKSSTVAKIFGWIAMAFAAVVAVAAVIVSGGALAPLVGLAVTGVMIGLQASGAMGKITEALAKAITSMLEGMGVPKEKAELAGQIVATIVVTAAAIALTLGASGAASAAQVGGRIGQIVEKIASFAARIAERIPQSVQTLAAFVSVAGKAIQGMSQIAQGGAQIGGAVHGKQAEDAKAGKLDIDKLLALIQARIKEDMDRIAQVQQDQASVIGHILDMIRGPAQTKDMIAQNIGGQTA